MTQTEIETIAAELLRANETGKMAELPSARPGFDLDAAYQVEAKLKQFRGAAGHQSVGRKVGYANKAIWRMLKLETLVWAHMYDDTVQYCEGNSASAMVRHPRSLKIEPEIVFGLREPIVAQGLDAAAAVAAIDWLALGFEIIDCPYPEWKFQPCDFVASFGLHYALVVGQKLKVTAGMIPMLVQELPQFKLRMFKFGELVEEGSGINSLKSPALCLAELGGAIARRFPDQTLATREIVSSGTLTAGHSAASGDVWTAEVEGIQLPPLTLRLM